VHRYFFPDLLLRILVHPSRPAPPHMIPRCLGGAISERLRLGSLCSGPQKFPLIGPVVRLPSPPMFLTSLLNVTVFTQ
jgi:hypothetical protein